MLSINYVGFLRDQNCYTTGLLQMKIWISDLEWL